MLQVLDLEPRTKSESGSLESENPSHPFGVLDLSLRRERSERSMSRSLGTTGWGGGAVQASFLGVS